MKRRLFQRIINWGTRDLENADDLAKTMRRMTAMSPRFERDYTSALIYKGDRLAEAGRLGEALAAIGECVEIARRGARDKPARFEPNLVTALHRQAEWLDRLERRDEAMAAFEEAIMIYRRLVAGDPDRLERPMVNAVIILSGWYGLANRPADAVPLLREAEPIARRLGETNPQVGEHLLGLVLGNLAASLFDLLEYEEALLAAEEAVEIRRRLYQADPAHEAHLATALDNLGVIRERLSQG